MNQAEDGNVYPLLISNLFGQKKLKRGKSAHTPKAAKVLQGNLATAISQIAVSKELSDIGGNEMSQVQDIMKRLNRQIAEINQESGNIYIVNAGNMNHGKSTLFNSLLDRDAFKAEDVRTTVKAQEEKYANNVYLVDTPGVDATDADDAAAIGAYQKAAFIVFVHNLGTGELHENEIKWINQMKEILGPDYFHGHFCIVLTFKDEIGADGLRDITEKIKTDLAQQCDMRTPLLFVVSNTTYRKGRDNKVPRLVEYSGFPDFKKFVDSHIETWEGELSDRVQGKVDNAKQKAVSQLTELRKHAQDVVARKDRRAMEKIKWLEHDISDAGEELSSMQGKVDVIKRRYNDAVEKRENIESQHAQARRNFR